MIKKLHAAKAAGVGLLASAAVLTATALPASADDAILNYPVAFTGGSGVRLVFDPNNTASADSGLTVPDGASFPVECWSSGAARTNVLGYTSLAWLRAPGGVYVNEAFLSTDAFGVPSGIPNCHTKDRATLWEVGAPSVFHDAGSNYVKLGDKIYVSRAATKDVYNTIEGWNSLSGAVVCTSVAAVSALIPNPAAVASRMIAGAVVGKAADLFCNSLAGVSDTAQLAAVLKQGTDRNECAVLSGHFENTIKNTDWATTKIEWTNDPVLCGDGLMYLVG